MRQAGQFRGSAQYKAEDELRVISRTEIGVRLAGTHGARTSQPFGGGAYTDVPSLESCVSPIRPGRLFGLVSNERLSIPSSGRSIDAVGQFQL